MRISSKIISPSQGQTSIFARRLTSQDMLQPKKRNYKLAAIHWNQRSVPHLRTIVPATPRQVPNYTLGPPVKPGAKRQGTVRVHRQISCLTGRIRTHGGCRRRLQSQPSKPRDKHRRAAWSRPGFHPMGYRTVRVLRVQTTAGVTSYGKVASKG